MTLRWGGAFGYPSNVTGMSNKNGKGQNHSKTTMQLLNTANTREELGIIQFHMLKNIFVHV